MKEKSCTSSKIDGRLIRTESLETRARSSIPILAPL